MHMHIRLSSMGIALLAVQVASGCSAVLCGMPHDGCSNIGGLSCMCLTHIPPHLLQAASFKLMGNFTLFGMVEVMCEVSQHVLFKNHCVHAKGGSYAKRPA